MPGNKAQWYAMKKRLQKAGKWTGDKAPSHPVPAREEGEPPEKRSREEEDPEPGDGAGSDPEEGTSKRAQGKNMHVYVIDPCRHLELLMDSVSWFGSIRMNLTGPVWRSLNGRLMRRNCYRTQLLYWEPGGGWILPITMIRGCSMHSAYVHALLWGFRQLYGL